MSLELKRQPKSAREALLPADLKVLNEQEVTAEATNYLVEYRMCDLAFTESPAKKMGDLFVLGI